MSAFLFKQDKQRVDLAAVTASGQWFRGLIILNSREIINICSYSVNYSKRLTVSIQYLMLEEVVDNHARAAQTVQGCRAELNVLTSFSIVSMYSPVRRLWY
jgi:hypothetical protein